MEIYDEEKKRRKFSVFRKTGFYGIKLISADSPPLVESKNIHSILLSWTDQTGESKNVPVVDDNSVTVKYSLRNIMILLFVVFFILLPLFVYLYLFTLVAMAITA